jgi:hypothetical protein
MGKIVRFRRNARHASEADFWMFRGLAGIAVVVEDVDSVAVEAGVNRTNIQLQIERGLGVKPKVS